MSSSDAEHPAAYRALGTSFAVVSDRPDLLEWIDDVWRHARGDDPPEHTFTLVSPTGAEPGAHWTFVVDDRVPQLVPEPEVVPRLHWEINALARAARRDAVVLHAAVVELHGVGIVVVGASGAGKSTLTLGLCERGAHYLSDELAAVRRDRVVVDAYPKPIALRPDSWPLVERLHPGLHPALAPLLRDEWFVTPQLAIETTEPRLVLFAEYDGAQSGASLRGVDRADALVRVCGHADELAVQSAGAFTALGALVAAADAYEVRSSDLVAACDLVRGLVERVRSR